jgi:hypothetical protein
MVAGKLPALFCRSHFFFCKLMWDYFVYFLKKHSIFALCSDCQYCMNRGLRRVEFAVVNLTEPLELQQRRKIEVGKTILRVAILTRFWTSLTRISGNNECRRSLCFVIP